MKDHKSNNRPQNPNQDQQGGMGGGNKQQWKDPHATNKQTGQNPFKQPNQQMPSQNKDKDTRGGR